MVIEGRNYILNSDVLEQVKDCSEKKKNEILLKDRKQQILYAKSCIRADWVLEKHATEPFDKWKSVTDVILYLKPLKLKTDPKLPTKRDDVVKLCEEWKDRKRKNLSTNEYVVSEIEKWKKEEIEKKASSRGPKKEKN